MRSSLFKLLVISSLAASCTTILAKPPQNNDPAVEKWQPGHELQQEEIWPAKVLKLDTRQLKPESLEHKRAPDVAAGREYTQIHNVSTPSITIYPPKTENSGAAVIVFPGGGFRILAIDLEGSEICDWLTSKGLTCVLLKYRVPKGNHYWDKDCKCHITPKVPYALQDAQRAIKLVRARAKDLMIDPNKIGVIGFSAGGYLVAQTSNIFESSYKAVDDIDKLSSRPDFAIALYPGHLCREGRKFDRSIIVTERTSPTFLLQAWDDPVDNICNSTLYAKQLSDAGVDSEVHLFAKGGHAFGLRNNPHPIAAWPTLVEGWLKDKKILRP